MPLADRYNLSYVFDEDEWYVSDKDGNDVTDAADEIYDELTAAMDTVREESSVVLNDIFPDMDMRSSLQQYAHFEAKTELEHAVVYSEIDYDAAVPPFKSSAKNYFIESVYPDGEVEDWVVNQQENGGYVHLFQSHIEEHVPGLKV